MNKNLNLMIANQYSIKGLRKKEKNRISFISTTKGSDTNSDMVISERSFVALVLPFLVMNGLYPTFSGLLMGIFELGAVTLWYLERSKERALILHIDNLFEDPAKMAGSGFDSSCFS